MVPMHGAPLCRHPIKRSDADLRLSPECAQEMKDLWFSFYLFLLWKQVPPVHERGLSEEGKATPEQKAGPLGAVQTRLESSLPLTGCVTVPVLGL